jgi:hypothetical protein
MALSPGSVQGSDKKKGSHDVEFAYRRIRHELAKTKLRVVPMWLRHRSLHPADVILASYPRSGSTWARFVLYEILAGEEATFDSVNEGLPGVQGYETALRRLPGKGRLIGTHERFRKEYLRAIYLVRDVRDVLLSEHAYLQTLDFFRGDLDRFTRLFVRGKVNGFGAWHNHVTCWLDSPIAEKNLLLVQYRDLRSNPELWFTRIADFLGVRTDAQRIRSAIANNSLEKMQPKVDGSSRMPWRKDRVVRSGSVEGWRAKISPAQLELVERHCGRVMTRLGYALTSNRKETEPELQSATR